MLKCEKICLCHNGWKATLYAASNVGGRTLKSDMFDVIQEDLAAFEPALEEAIVSETPLITDIGMHLISSGGKRLRPALCRDLLLHLE